MAENGREKTKENFIPHEKFRLVENSLKIFLRAGNNPALLKNSSEHAELMFIALSDMPMNSLKNDDYTTCFGLPLLSAYWEIPPHVIGFYYVKLNPGNCKNHRAENFVRIANIYHLISCQGEISLGLSP